MTENIDNSNEVFEEINRKMKYGAPELKKFYQKYVTRGLIIAVIAHLILIGSYVGAMYLNKVKADQEKVNQDKVFNLEDLNMPLPIDEVPLELKDVALKDLASLVPEPVAKKLVTEEIKLKTQKELEDVKLPVASTGTDDPSKVNPNATVGKIEEKKVEEKIEKKEEKKKEVFQSFEVEKAPVAVNLGSVKSSMRYPEIARQSGIEGRVVAKVLVGADGSVIKVGGISGPEVFHDEVADKVMNLSFDPAIQGGQKVKCWVSVPFSFTLNANDRKKSEDKEEKSDDN